LIISFGLLAC